MASRRRSHKVRLSDVHYTFGIWGRDHNEYSIDALIGSKHVGGIDLALRRGAKTLQVTTIAIDDAIQRQGIGTRLYEAAAALACRMGVRFSSSSWRSKYSDGFWKKQIAKGRAKYVTYRDRGRRFRAVELHDACTDDLSGINGLGDVTIPQSGGSTMARRRRRSLGDFQEGRSDHTGTKLVLVLAAGLGALWWVRRGQRREDAAAEARWAARVNQQPPAPVVAQAPW